MHVHTTGNVLTLTVGIWFSLAFPLFVSLVFALEIDTKLITFYCMFYYHSTGSCAMERFTASFVIATLDLSASVEIALLTALHFVAQPHNEIHIVFVFGFKQNADSVSPLNICRILLELLTTLHCN